MAQTRKNQFHIYRGYIDKLEEEIQANQRVEPLYPAGLQVQKRPAPKGASNKVEALLMNGVQAQREQLPSNSPIAQRISEKLQEFSNNYHPGTGSALELKEVFQDGTFTYTSFYRGEKSKMWGNWVQQDNIITVTINGWRII